DSRKEISRSMTGHYVNGDSRSFLGTVKDGGIHKQILFGRVRFWSVFYRNDSWESRAGNNDSTYRRTFRIQRCGRRIVDGKGDHVSRLRGYRTLVPDDSDV